MNITLVQVAKALNTRRSCSSTIINNSIQNSSSSIRYGIGQIGNTEGTGSRPNLWDIKGSAQPNLRTFLLFSYNLKALFPNGYHCQEFLFNRDT